MSLMLPDSVEWVLEMLGFDWPTADEDKLRESARVWRDFADQVDELHYRGVSAANGVLSSNSGDSVDAFRATWGKFSGGGSDGYLADAAMAARLIAGAFEAAAVIVVACKVAVIAQLVALAVELIAAQAAAPFTLGLSELGAAGATAATRMIVRRLLKELRQALMEAIMETLKEPAVSAIQGMISDLIAQTVNQNFGAQSGYDLGRTAKRGAEDFTDAVKNSGETFKEALRDGAGSRAGGHARSGIDHAAGRGDSSSSGGHGSDGSSSSDGGGSDRSGGGGEGSSGTGSGSGSGSGSGGSGSASSGGSSSSGGPSQHGAGGSGPTISSSGGGSDHGVDGGGRSTAAPRPPRAESGPALDPFGTRVGTDHQPSAHDAGPSRTSAEGSGHAGADGGQQAAPNTNGVPAGDGAGVDRPSGVRAADGPSTPVAGTPAPGSHSGGDAPARADASTATTATTPSAQPNPTDARPTAPAHDTITDGSSTADRSGTRAARAEEIPGQAPLRGGAEGVPAQGQSAPGRTETAAHPVGEPVASSRDVAAGPGGSEVGQGRGAVSDVPSGSVADAGRPHGESAADRSGQAPLRGGAEGVPAHGQSAPGRTETAAHPVGEPVASSRDVAAGPGGSEVGQGRGAVSDVPSGSVADAGRPHGESAADRSGQAPLRGGAEGVPAHGQSAPGRTETAAHPVAGESATPPRDAAAGPGGPESGQGRGAVSDGSSGSVADADRAGSVPAPSRPDVVPSGDGRAGAPAMATEPARVDPRSAFADPAAPAPHLNTAGLGATATVTPPSASEHRTATSPPTAEHPAPTAGVTGPVGVPHTGTPAAGRPPGDSPAPGVPAQRRTAPETPSGAPVPPRPAADRGTGTRPDPRAAFSVHRSPSRPDVASGPGSSRPDSHRPTDPARSEQRAQARPDSAVSPDSHRPTDTARPEDRSPVRPDAASGQSSSRADVRRPADPARPDAGSDSGSSRVDSRRPTDSARPEDRSPVRPDAASGQSSSRADVRRPADPARPDVGSDSGSSRADSHRPTDSARPEDRSSVRPDAASGESSSRADVRRPADPARPDAGSDSGSSRADSHRPTDTARPEHGSPSRPGPAAGSDSSRADSHRPVDPARSEGNAPKDPVADRSKEDSSGVNSRPEQGNTPERGPVGDQPPYRPAAADRPLGGPGGLLEPDARDHERVRDAVPQHPDGTPQRHPDPHDGDWPGAINGHDPNGPGRTNNCVDVALATVDTYSGHPTPAAARTPDHDGDGNPSPLGERGGRDRIENALGARFSDFGDGPDAYRRLEDVLRKNGHGAQAVIITTDRDGRSHAWNAVNHQGRITYIDAQTGRRSDQPLHDGSSGVFAVPLDPNRRPAAPAASPETDPSRIHEDERRAPERPAGADDTSTDPPPDGRYNDDAERQRVRAQVANANNDPEWFKKHYNVVGSRKFIGMKDENGNEIPQLRQNPDWAADPDNHDRWVAAQDAPPPAAEDYHHDREVLREAAVPADRERAQKIEDAITKREAALAADRVAEEKLKEAKDAHEADKNDDDAKKEYERLKEAHKDPHHKMGKAGEELGDQVAEFHAVPENFPDATRVDDRKDGNNRFDQIWERPDGSFVVVEAKAPTASLGDRRALDGRQVMQGHPDYFKAILGEMAKRGKKDIVELELMTRLRAAMEDGKVDYVMVQARVDGGQYDGYRMKHFNIDVSAQEGSLQ
ncbi:toxin glutamine deamidase domain-containing protein [Kitasatospora griseola]